MKLSNSRMRFLYLLEALEKETDEEHPLSAQELCAILAEKGIQAERKSLYRDIAALNEIGYEIGSTRQPKSGFFLMKRDFELPEVRLLIDAVQSAPFLTAKKTAQLTEKLCGLVSRPQSVQLEPQLSVERRNKFDNEEIYYTIDALHAAIANQKKISFRYFHKELRNCRAVWNEGREFVVSPYALLWSNDKYYLAANYEKYDTISNYRLDRMKRVCMVDEPARPFQEISEYRESFDAADYLKCSFHMYRGKMEDIRLICDGSLLEDMLDRFDSDELQLSREGEGFLLRSRAYVSDGLVEWLLQYGGRVQVLDPSSLKDRMQQEALNLCRVYGIHMTE